MLRCADRNSITCQQTYTHRFICHHIERFVTTYNILRENNDNSKANRKEEKIANFTMGGKWSKYSKIVIICQGVHFRILIGWVLEKLNDDMANNI